MSKKDKDKDKRKKGEGNERSSWMADLRPARGEGRETRGATPKPALAPEPEPAPPTRRSSPLPVYEVNLPPRIPPLRPLPFDVRPAEDGGDPDGMRDDIPSTEPFAAVAAPDSGPDPIEAAPVPVTMGETPQPPAQPARPSVEQLERQIRDLEARLDEMISRGSPASQPVAVQASASLEAPAPRATARELLSPDFYLRQWGRASLRRRAEEVDEFGFDPKYEARLLPFLDFLYKRYFRVETEGSENIPTEGRCLLVANHSGGPLPYDGLMLRTAVRREHAAHRELRWLAEDFVYHLPFVGTAMNRLGAVRACQENAERLLSGGNLVAVFPEGAKGIGKLFKDRYRLQRFGRGGFIRLCLRTGTPLVPSAIVGAEEASPMLYRVEYLTKALGIPYLPITPTFPALGPLGLLPAPTKWKITLGEPILFDSYGPDAADDDILVGRLADRVRATIQGLLDRSLAGRKSVWFG